jgi:hypothetical protein
MKHIDDRWWTEDVNTPAERQIVSDMLSGHPDLLEMLGL